MKHVINKERTWLFAPAVIVATQVKVRGRVEIAAIRQAVITAIGRNEIMNTTVQMKHGTAYFKEGMNAQFSFQVTGKSSETIRREQEKVPFDLEKGEYLRFFVLTNGTVETEEDWTLLLLAHHLAGDGLSYAYLIQDIMRVLSGETIETKPIQLFDLTSLPEKSRISGGLKLMMGWMNWRWKNTGCQFPLKEYKRLHEHYWKQHNTYTTVTKIQGEGYSRLMKYSKETGLTVNTIITTALCKAALECGEKRRQNIGQAVSIRQDGYEGMGNFATGISVQYRYDPKLSFEENGKRVQTSLQQKLGDPKKKYFLLQFMGNIEGSLQDAVYFAAVGGYDNNAARFFSKMFGYDGNPKGISVTNLTKLPIRSTYGRFELTDYIFIPPLVLNAKRIFGIATLNDQMTISYSVEDDTKKEYMLRYFNQCMEVLEQLG